MDADAVDIDAAALLRCTGLETLLGYCTLDTVTRALWSQRGRSELVVASEEPETGPSQIRREGHSIGDRLALEGQGQPIAKSPEQGQEPEQAPEALAQAWVLVEGIEELAQEHADQGQGNQEQETEGVAWNWYYEMSDESGQEGYPRERFEYGMCSFDTSDTIRRWVISNCRRYTLPDGTIDDGAIKMVILTCLSSSIA